MEHDVGGADGFSNLFYRNFLRVIYLSWVLDSCLKENIILMATAKTGQSLTDHPQIPYPTEPKPCADRNLHMNETYPC